jgi:hypothetical protein
MFVYLIKLMVIIMKQIIPGNKSRCEVSVDFTGAPSDAIMVIL